MNLLFICKASVEIGFGHIVRARSLANALYIEYKDLKITFFAIGDQSLSSFLPLDKYKTKVVNTELNVISSEKYDACILDMLTTGDQLLQYLKEISGLLISLSPVYDQFSQIDILFHRTKYFEIENNKPKYVYSGLDYTIVQEDCKKISTAQYEKNLQHEYFPVAISMGGGDAANLTLNCLKELRKSKVPATFWVVLGEGYQFSYDDLVAEIKADNFHEILLVRTNKSMWQILENCLIMVVPGGITAYEATYAGVPTLVYNKNSSTAYLTKELTEHNVSFSFSDWEQMRIKLEELYLKKKELMLMHIHSKDIIGKKAHKLIYEKINFHLQK